MASTPTSARVDHVSPASEFRLLGLGVTAIVAATCLVYLPAMKGDFLWDDDILLTNNPTISAADGLYRIWFTMQAFDYWPISNSTLWFEWRLWGMNPIGYHVTNLAMHVIASLLVWAVLKKLSIPGAFLAALLFAIHPLNVESVAWVAQRKTVLALVFFLLSIRCYLEILPSETGRPSHRAWWSWYLLSLAAFVLAMLSKSSVATLPLVLLLVTWWIQDRVTARDVAWTAPFFLIAIVLTLVNIWFQQHHESMVRPIGPVARVLGAAAVPWFYLWKFIAPLDLIFIYPQWDIRAEDWHWWIPLAVDVAFVAVLFWYRRRPWARALLFAWGFFCLALVPVMGFVDAAFMKWSLVADHYVYVAIIAAAALAAVGWSFWSRQAGMMNRVSQVTAALVIGLLMLLTWRQTANYSDAETHWRSALAGNPDFPTIRYNLGLMLAQKGSLSEATEQFEESLRLKPDWVESYNNLGNVLVLAGKPQEAIAQFQQALKHDPNYLPARYNLGTTLLGMNRPQEAIEHLEQAVRLKPDLAAAHHDLAKALFNAGRPQEAIQHLEQWLKVAPDDLTAWSNLAAAYAMANRSAEAVAAGQKALELARAQGKPELAEQLAEWLTSVRSGGAAPAKELPATELPASALPPAP